MISLQWSPDLSVGVELIDQQHQGLITRLNALIYRMTGPSTQEVSEMLDFLAQYVVEHFGTEEQYMASHRYPGRSAHRREHKAFVHTFMELKQRFTAEGLTPTFALDVETQLCQWMVTHIRGTDMAMGQFLKTRLSKTGAAA